MQAGFAAFLTVLTAELSDKSMLLALMLAAKYRLRDVMFGIGLAAVALSGLAVLVGLGFSNMLGEFAIALGAGVGFALFGMLTLWGGGEEHCLHTTRTRVSAIWVFGMFFMAELGDKTQLYTIAMCAGHPKDVWFLFVGSALGLLGADLVGIALGRWLGGRIPVMLLRRIGFCLFSVFALQSIQHAMSLIQFGYAQVIVWLLAALMCTLLCVNLVKKRDLRLRNPKKRTATDRRCS